MKNIDVLDKGFVRLVDHMGTDTTVVNAARVSFSKFVSSMDTTGRRLLRYLANNNHWTPFGHPQIQLHIKAPIFVRTQMFKHKVGFVENEVSRRYITQHPEFFIPNQWRAKSEKAKQGSSDAEINDIIVVRNAYITAIELASTAYDTAIVNGVAPELARGILPQCTYTEWYWTGSLSAYFRFYKQRSAYDAQKEVQMYSFAVEDIIHELFPDSWEALKDA